MAINEIFTSLQGEGFHTGTVATFIRFSGCNLRCPFCDTDFTQHTTMTEDEIVDHVEMGSFVVLTGGEPSLQVTESLVTKLHDKGCYVAIETNGTHPLPQNIDWITCSPKDESLPIVIGQANEIKVVYTGQDVEAIRLRLRADHWFLQPCDSTYSHDCKDHTEDNHRKDRRDGMNISQVVSYIMEHPWWRLSLQTHKLIGIQ